MVNLKIDEKPIRVEENATILDAARMAGIEIPTLCYLKDISETGACRVCAVEIEGASKLSAACNTTVEDGMVVRTNSRRAREARRVNTELLLSAHNVNCPSCVRGGNCSLQSLAESLNIEDVPYGKKFDTKAWPKDFPLRRDESKCVKCMRCVAVCDKVQSLGVWDVRGLGSRLAVGVTGGANIDESACVLCGQCVTHCPVGALSARDDTAKVLAALADPQKIVLVQIAPAIRAAWGEGLGLSREEASVGRMVAAVRKLGADYVFDTNFAADLTIMEEGSELLQRLSQKAKHKWPMFTSCCPGWVSFLKSQYPEMAPNLSTAKSPQQMFGAAAKSWFAKRAGIDPEKIFSVSIMPCMAKKNECTLPDMDSAKTGQDVDAVITNRELNRMLRSCHTNVRELGEEKFDDVLGEGTGAAVIFGVTGGVMEAALRSAYALATGKNPDPDRFSAVRGMFGWREATVEINKTKVRAAVASGLANAREIIEKVKSGEAEYDFVEVMACPGGCVGGGGQPITDGRELAPERSPVLYGLDHNSSIRFSHENPSV
ncbi:MAG: [FeFe] hydrogenase, group A [Spirochaetaceae bacterium]|nr:[FeFe] hydrogenase, group A [Spirochaetaceae bacterium]